MNILEYTNKIFQLNFIEDQNAENWVDVLSHEIIQNEFNNEENLMKMFNNLVL
jgi:hypothetical protein